MNCNWLFLLLKKPRIYFLPVGALTHLPTESKASVLHLETLSQQHWAAQTSKSVLATHPPSQSAGAGPPAMLLKSVFCHPDIYTDFPHIWKCCFHPKTSELVFLHVLATSLHALVLHDVKEKEMASWLTSQTGMSLGTKSLSLCLFTAPDVHTSAGACKGVG